LKEFPEGLPEISIDNNDEELQVDGPILEYLKGRMKYYNYECTIKFL
jgi:hypothetical protein